MRGVFESSSDHVCEPCVFLAECLRTRMLCVPTHIASTHSVSQHIASTHSNAPWPPHTQNTPRNRRHVHSVRRAAVLGASARCVTSCLQHLKAQRACSARNAEQRRVLGETRCWRSRAARDRRKGWQGRRRQERVMQEEAARRKHRRGGELHARQMEQQGGGSEEAPGARS